MSAYPPCSECDGTGWILYRAETVDGELEEAYRLCTDYCSPRYCMSRSNVRSCVRPGTERDGLKYFCKQHVEVICYEEDVNHAPTRLPSILRDGCG